MSGGAAFVRSTFRFTKLTNDGALVKPKDAELSQDLISLRGDVLSVIQTQVGSKMVQRLLFEDEVASRMIVSELEPHLVDLMCDRYANYACSIIFSAMPPSRRRK